jgi:hypothetical protein
MKQKYNIIYKITNTVNNKIYIGAHSTKNLNDSYFGSGVAIKTAIKKYGKENFQKEIIFYFNTEDEMYLKEKEIANSEFISRKDTYNMKEGGNGGWSHINNYGDNNPMKNKETVKKVSKSISNTINFKLKNDEEYSKKFSEKCRKGGLTHIGRKDSQEVKSKRVNSYKETLKNKIKKFKLLHKNGTITLHSTLSEICQTYNLSRNVLNKWLDKGEITRTKNATKTSVEGYNCYGFEIQLIKENI